MTEKMKLLLIEDEVAECDRFVKIAESKLSQSINFIKVTSSSDEGIACVLRDMPDGVILDLELNFGNGSGSGLDFLRGIKDSELKPIIFVTTNTPSKMVHNLIRDLGVDFIFYKRQQGYNPEVVLNNILDLFIAHGGKVHDFGSKMCDQSEQERRKEIKSKIDEELDAIGISIRYKGRLYIEEAISLLVCKEVKAFDAVLHKVADNNNITYSSVLRSAQTAINNTWDTTRTDYLLEHYTSRIDIRAGVPSPTEFIRYYAEKIMKSL